jgi:hypothetical protein
MLAEWWGDWSSLLGLIVGLAGFIITIHLLLKSKSAIQAAAGAAEDTNKRTRTAFALTDIATTIAIAQEIRRLQRAAQWPIALDRYSHLRSHLVQFRAENPSLTPLQATQIQNAIAQVASLENAVEQLVSGTRTTAELARWNRILAEVLEALESLTANLKHSGGALP